MDTLHHTDSRVNVYILKDLNLPSIKLKCYLNKYINEEIIVHHARDIENNPPNANGFKSILLTPVEWWAEPQHRRLCHDMKLKPVFFVNRNEEHLDLIPENALELFFEPYSLQELIIRLKHTVWTLKSQSLIENEMRAFKVKYSDLLRENRQLKDLIFLDRVTHTAHRSYYMHTLKKEWKQAQRNKTNLSLLNLQINDINEYLEMYGKSKTKQTLSKVAEAMNGLFRRPMDLISRVYRGQFAFIFPQTSLKGLGHLSRQMTAVIEGLNISHAGTHLGNKLSINLGGVVYEPRNRDFSPLDGQDHIAQALIKSYQKGPNQIALETIS